MQCSENFSHRNIEIAQILRIPTINFFDRLELYACCMLTQIFSQIDCPAYVLYRSQDNYITATYLSAGILSKNSIL